MAKIKHSGFREVETDYEEIEEKVRQHRKKIIRRVIEIILLAVLGFFAIRLIYSVQSYDDYEVKSAVDRSATYVTQFEEFGDCILEYSNDGISCITKSGIPVWNQSFEMASPEVEICGEYLVVYNQGGTDIYILSKEGLQKKIETTSAIQKVSIAGQGSVAVLMKEEAEAQIKLYDKKGKELANGKFYDNKGGIPIAVALSKDAKKMAISMIDVTGKEVGTTITFYNFGTVGQSQIDNNVGTYNFTGTLIPEIKYVSEDRMLAFGTDRILIFEGSQKPEVAKEIELVGQVRSYFHNEKYLGIVYEQVQMEDAWHVQVMDMRGKTVMETDTEIEYNKIYFLPNNEMCIMNETACEIYTVLGTKKFTYTFDKEIYQIISNGSGHNYIFVFKETTEEVRLK